MASESRRRAPCPWSPWCRGLGRVFGWGRVRAFSASCNACCCAKLTPYRMGAGVTPRNLRSDRRTMYTAARVVSASITPTAAPTSPSTLLVRRQMSGPPLCLEQSAVATPAGGGDEGWLLDASAAAVAPSAPSDVVLAAESAPGLSQQLGADGRLLAGHGSLKRNVCRGLACSSQVLRLSSNARHWLSAMHLALQFCASVLVRASKRERSYGPSRALQ